MARLNDFAAPAESIESLKRRFVRQNREIARVNSMQSLRIRSLESEVSHLLGENVSLREQVINLTTDIERLEAAKTLHDGVYEIKTRLDAKLAELNSLASDLGRLPRKVGIKFEHSDRPKACAPEPRPITELDPIVDDGRLPPIREDKFFPRRTLEAQEIQDLVETDMSPSQSATDNFPIQNTELPENDTHEETELPKDEPPVETSFSPIRETSVDMLDEEPTQPLPPTLETRKKKKRTDTTTALEKSVPQDEPVPSDKPTQPTKSGSKRKFSPDEDGFFSDTPDDDEFQFSRPSQSPRRRSGLLDMGRPDLSPSKTPRTMKRVPPGGITKRKVLEPKSANVNLASPKKSRTMQPENKITQLMGDNENAVSPKKPKQLDVPKAKVSREGRPATKTKAKRASAPAEDPFSEHAQLTSSQKRDSPVAKSVAMETIADLAASSRTSRRRGAVVSYAEPNLRDKMRRPTKDMIDAVAKDGRRSSSFQLPRDSIGSMGDGSSDIPPARSTSPTPGNMPADFALADQAAGALAKVAQRPSRRHSSNPKKTAYSPSPANDETLESPDSSNVSLGQVDTSFQDDDAWKSVAHDAGYRRETRVASRRRSMMV